MCYENFTRGEQSDKASSRSSKPSLFPSLPHCLKASILRKPSTAFTPSVLGDATGKKPETISELRKTKQIP